MCGYSKPSLIFLRSMDIRVKIGPRHVLAWDQGTHLLLGSSNKYGKDLSCLVVDMTLVTKNKVQFSVLLITMQNFHSASLTFSFFLGLGDVQRSRNV